MRKLIVLALVLCFSFTLSSCASIYKCTLTDYHWNSTTHVLDIDYRFTNLGTADIVSYNICFNIRYNGGSTMSQPYSKVYLLPSGVIHWDTASFTLDLATSVENVTIGSFSASTS